MMAWLGFTGSIVSCICFVYLNGDAIFPILGGAGLTLGAINVFFNKNRW